MENLQLNMNEIQERKKSNCNCQALSSMNGLNGTEIFRDFGNNQIYFKIKVETMDAENKKMKIEIYDISDIILGQQKLSDKIYRDSVLSNYSHE
jgi:hypothetical protein